MSFNNWYRYKLTCRTTTLSVYHRYPELRLYVPYDITQQLWTTIQRQEGVLVNRYINGNKITDYSYFAINKKTGKRRLVINAEAVKKYDLDTNTKYKICFTYKIPMKYIYRIEGYFSYDIETIKPANSRQFAVSYITPIIQDYDTILKVFKDAITEALGSDYYDLVVGGSGAIAGIRYLGYERLPSNINYELQQNTEVNYGYVIADYKMHYRPYNWSNISVETAKALIDYKLSYIGIDYDNTTLTEIETRLSLLKQYDIEIKYIDIYRTNHGYHVYIWLNKPIKPELQLEIRDMLGDDKNRLNIDIIKGKIGNFAGILFNTLFVKKWAIVNGKFEFISHETFIKRIKAI